MKVIGFDLRIYRGGTLQWAGHDGYRYPRVVGGEVILQIPPTYALMQSPIWSAPKVSCVSEGGYPCLYQMRAGDLPYELALPPDEILWVELWDQS